MDYLYWSAPVTGQGLKAFSPGTPDNRIFQYNEPNDLFKAVPLATEPNFVPGKGYAFRAESGTGISNPYSKTYKFKGVPNNGFIESMNNKVKLVKRNAYGYRYFYNLRKRILLHLGFSYEFE